MPQFFDLPEKWIALRKIAANIQHEIASIQSHQVDSIKRKIFYFSQLVKLFRDRFTSMQVSAFRFSIEFLMFVRTSVFPCAVPRCVHAIGQVQSRIAVH